MSESRLATSPYDTAWELIPWYVNGSLSEDEAAEVARFAAEDDAFAAEVDAQRSLLGEVVTLPDPEAAMGRSWDSLKSRIEADQRARTAPARAPRWRIGFGAFLGAGALAAALVVAVVALQQPEDGFRTLTDDPALAGPSLQFQVNEGTDIARLTALLAEQGLQLTGGPSAGGVFTAALPEGADPAEAAEALMAAPEVPFAAPAVAP